MPFVKTEASRPAVALFPDRRTAKTSPWRHGFAPKPPPPGAWPQARSGRCASSSIGRWGGSDIFEGMTRSFLRKEILRHIGPIAHQSREQILMEDQKCARAGLTLVGGFQVDVRLLHNVVGVEPRAEPGLRQLQQFAPELGHLSWATASSWAKRRPRECRTRAIAVVSSEPGLGEFAPPRPPPRPRPHPKRRGSSPRNRTRNGMRRD